MEQVHATEQYPRYNSYRRLQKQEINIMKFYWVTTEDHDEDWFIVASSAEEASEFHFDIRI